MKFNKTLCVCLTSVIFCSGLALAKTPVNKKKGSEPTSESSTSVPAVDESVYLFSGTEDFKTASTKLARDLASADICTVSGAAKVDVTSQAIEAKMKESQPDFIRLRDEVIGNEEKNISGIKTKEQLDAFIKRYSGNENSDQRKAYLKLDPAAKMLVLQLRALEPMKSFFFRAKQYVGKNSITRTSIVTMLRAQAVGIQNFAQVTWGATNPFVTSPNSNLWEAAFTYMTENMPDMGPKIDRDTDLEVFLGQLLNQSIAINNDFKVIVDEAIRNQSSFWWDNKLFLSIANFVDPKDRYIKLGVAELLAIRSALSLSVSSLAATTSYSFSGFQDAIGRVGQLMGFDISNAMAKNGAEGMTSKNRFKILSNERALFVRKRDYEKRMKSAYYNLRDSVYQARSSYNCVLKRSADDQFLFDVRFAQSMNRIALNSLGNLVTLFETQKVNSTVIAGETIKVDLWAFYSNPPDRLSDLYPTAFNDESNGTLPGVNVMVWNNQSDKLRNYKYESSRAWRAKEYKKLFPEMEDKGGVTTEVGKYARILSQTWGTAAFAIPLSAFVF